MAENILSSGVEVCREIKQKIEELAETKASAEAAKAAATQGEKSVKAKEKAIKEEIAATVKKRKEEIEQSFDSEVENLKQRTKEVQDEKGKDKGEQQARRIENETAGNREKERELLLEIRSIFKRDGIPGIFNTKLYYALFMPRTIWEIVQLLLAIIITLVCVPSLIYFVFVPEVKRTTLAAMIVYYACLFVFIGLYFVISQVTKGKHRETFAEVLKLRKEIRLNQRDINAIAKKVQRDKDESKYDLGHYDHEIERISDEVDAILAKKKDALKEFENETKDVITEQIVTNNQPELDELKNFVTTRTEEEKRSSERAKELGLYIASNYEPFIGKSDLNVETLSKIINIMESGKANTIGDAIAYLKQPIPEAQLEEIMNSDAETVEATATESQETVPADSEVQEIGNNQ